MKMYKREQMIRREDIIEGETGNEEEKGALHTSAL
jgi:hypothetical protein